MLNYKNIVLDYSRKYIYHLLALKDMLRFDLSVGLCLCQT